MKTINNLLEVEEVNSLIKQDNILILAGHEESLNNLVRGNWIGGTIPYFMAENGGCFDKEKIFVTNITDYVKNVKIRLYGTDSINNITKDRYGHGFSYILIPGFSDVLSSFALNAQKLDNIYNMPLTGWVTGIDLNDIGKINPKIFDGNNLKKYDNRIVVMHVELLLNKIADLEILNIFHQGNGDSIEFIEEGFSCTNCLINGVEQNLAEYIEKNNINTKLPLVADYSGAMINISFQNIDKENKSVLFYAPLRKNTVYKLAKPIENYVKEFNSMVKNDANGEIIASCNCILNYIYSELEGKKTGVMKGPFTFGEIAYVLVNQTMVYLSILDK